MKGTACHLKVIYFVFLFFVLFSQTFEGQGQSIVSSKPNIIYIVADDLGYGDLSAYGQEKFETPNIDRLAKEGMLFTQHYAGSTVCAPSRAALMTGLHTGHIEVRGNKGINGGQFPLSLEAITIPKLLKENGYVTGAFGKWGLGYPGSTGAPLNQGFDEFFGYNSQTIAHNYFPRELYDNDKLVELVENRDTLEGLYAPDLIHQKTLDFIDRHKDSPFFLFVPSIIPHAELVAPAEYMQLFLEKTNPDSMYISVFEPEPAYRGVDDPENPRYKMGAYGSQPMPRAAFAAMIKLLDDQVGEILDKLDDLGLAENTLVIFTSDNGPHKEGGADPDFFNSNGQFKGYKRDLYEGGIRVPMLARWPGKITAGTETVQVSTFWDVLPTLADVTGVAIPEGIDGISFLPTLLGENSQKNHASLYWEFHEQNGKQAVRKGNWKAIRLNVFSEGSEVLLFDLSKDPGETSNLANEYPKVLMEMLEIMDRSRTEDSNWPFAHSSVK
ncbi:arylsulfatase [Algoriphagus chordae]|uniref:Arylsulfatase A-like enzyme n=1 Tax=Algoriphagus chordae TaxID=237019 RepID=A0A2W7QS02_9BACT|nr:arylsulfatase [Algoriphagus chordae]PZX51044.1 arylsulfatase A-like enzyme [Algoriphagus chordae]